MIESRWLFSWAKHTKTSFFETRSAFRRLCQVVQKTFEQKCATSIVQRVYVGYIDVILHAICCSGCCSSMFFYLKHETQTWNTSAVSWTDYIADTQLCKLLVKESILLATNYRIFRPWAVRAAEWGEVYERSSVFLGLWQVVIAGQWIRSKTSKMVVTRGYSKILAELQGKAPTVYCQKKGESFRPRRHGGAVSPNHVREKQNTRGGRARRALRHLARSSEFNS